MLKRGPMKKPRIVNYEDKEIKAKLDKLIEILEKLESLCRARL